MRKFRFALICIALAATAQADTLTCRYGKIVQPGMSVADVIARCGEPTSKETSTTDVRRRTAAGGSVKVGEEITETWRYERGSGKQTAILVVREGKVVSIDFE